MSEKCVITLDQTDELQKKAFTFAYELAKNAELSNETLCDFWNKLVVNKEVYEEFVYFMDEKKRTERFSTAGSHHEELYII